MDLGRAVELLSRFGDSQILVVGDYFLDKDVFGRFTGLSLEAPTPVFEPSGERCNPGAAGNLACNCASLGAHVIAVGVVGSDLDGKKLLDGLSSRGIDITGMVVEHSHPTNTYGKIKASVPGGHPQEILRIDTPPPLPITGALEAQVIQAIEERMPDVSAIIVADQAGAVATESVRRAITDYAKRFGVITLADSRSHISAFTDFDVLLPNIYEASSAAGMIGRTDEAAVAEAGSLLLRVGKRVVIKRGDQGLSCFDGDKGIFHFNADTPSRCVVDATGAGDTLAAALTMGLTAGGTLEEAAWLGTIAAGIVVRKAGVTALSRIELEEAVRSKRLASKLRSLEELEILVPPLQAEGKRVVWTNGCFDILHAGHVLYLQAAAQEGDVLIAGMNSDDSVRAIKGPTRPVVREQERAIVLSALACVDYVVIFSDPTTVPALKRLKPDVYAKGGDYTIETINQEERRLIESYGGCIALLPGVQGQSTTNLIERMRQ